jgi:hypothetical protein
MKSKPVIILLGFTCSFLVAMCVHFRIESIRRSAPVHVASADAGKTSGGSFVPAPPVAEDGSALLFLEKTAYALPAAGVNALVSPVFIPVLVYPDQFYGSKRSNLRYDVALPPEMESSVMREGTVWGIVQSIVFYLPFILISTKKRQP